MTRVPSPLSTGGAGTIFEQHVGAMFLVLLLTRGIPAIFRDCQVEEVGFQTRRLGWETDDLLVTCSSRSGPRRLAMQIRLSFTVGKSDGCKEAIQRFWNDFNADLFNPARDALVLATLHRTGNLGGLDSLLACARSSPSPDDFKDRLETPGFISDAARGCHREIRSIVNNVRPGSASEEMLWRFLRTVYVLFLDFTTDTAQQEATVTQWLAQSSGDPDAADAARATWRDLVAIAADAALRAKTLRHSDMPPELRERYGAVPAPMLQALTDHSATILNGIHSTIGGKTTLPRTEVTIEAAMALGDRVVALTGPPGSGKSALAKAVIWQHSDSHLCLSFRATEFAKSHIDDVLMGPISGERFRLFVGAQERVLIHVDGLERLLECPVRDAFGDLVDMAELCPNVSLVLTCRDTEMENAAMAFFGRSPLICHRVKVPPLSADEMKQVGREISGLGDPLSRRELARIMSAPYVLDMAARMDWSDRQNFPSDMGAFQKKWWSEMVRKDGETADRLPGRRERTLIDLAVRRTRELRPSVPTDEMDAEALDRLRKDGIVVVGDDGLAAPAHDVIEDWAVMRHVDLLAAKSEWQAPPMAENLGTSPAVRRGFRGWLRERLDTNSVEADRFVLAAYGDGLLPQRFREDMLISVLLSGSVGDFVLRQKDILLKDDAHLLVKMVHLMRIACTKTPDTSGDQPAHQSVLSEPEGEAWPALLHVVAEIDDRLLRKHFYHLLGLLEDWARGTKSSAMPDGAVPAIRIAYRLLALLWDRRHNDLRKRIFGIIASVPRADSENFLYLVERASSKSGWNNFLLNEFRHILTGPDGISACRDHPEAMAEFAMSLRLMPEQDYGVQEYGAHFYSESKFGLRAAARADFRHFSAFCGPFWGLLRCHPKAGLRLVLDLVNHAGESYGSRCEDQIRRVTISVPGHGKVEQWANDRLWLAYRGTSDVPHFLMCALMALEHLLLKMCEHGYDVEHWLLDILGESNNVMTAGVVASVCTAHPDLGGEATLALLESQYCIELDGLRRKKEGHPPTTRYVAANRQEKYFDDERKISDALPHRRHDLESLARKLQSGSREGSPPDGEGRGRAAAFGADKTNAYTQDRNTPEAENLRAGASTSLYDWGLKRWERDSSESGMEPWQKALALARDGAEQHVESDRVHSTNNGPPVVAAVCVRDHWGEMSIEERRWCAGALAAEVWRYSDHKRHLISPISFPTDSDSIAAHSLPKILANDPDDRKILAAVACSLAHASPDVRLNSAKGVGEYLEPKHRSLALQCAGAVAMLSNLLAGNGQRRSQKGRTPIPNWYNGKQSVPELARRALADRSIDAEAELECLDLASRRGKSAAVPLMHMLGRAPDLPATKRFIAKIGRAVVDTWTAKDDAFWNLHDEFENNATGGLAEIILSLPRAMLDYCQPFLDVIDVRPNRVALFIKSLVMSMDGSSAGRPFWDVWQAFADRIVKAPWVSGTVSYDSKGAELIGCMVFDMGRLKGSRRWAYLAGHEERVCEFVGRLPPTPHVLASFAHYLYASGAGSNTIPLKTLAGCLRAGEPAELLGSEDTVYCLAYVLQGYVYGRPAMLKRDPTLREDTFLILNQLVDAGSSAAYRMRDDFSTPNVGK